MITAKTDVFIGFDFWWRGNKNLVGGIFPGSGGGGMSEVLIKIWQNVDECIYEPIL